MMINSLKTNSKERFYWLDYLKVVGLYLMVLGHTMAEYQSSLSIWIYSFHIPLFFIISGYLTKSDKKIYFNKHVKSLLVPYFLLNIIGLLFSIPRIINGGWTNIGSELSNLLLFIIGQPYGHTSPTWFVFSLFFVKLFFEISKKYGLQNYLLVISIILSICVKNQYLNIPEVLFRIIVSYPYIIVGYYLKKTNLINIKYKVEFILLFLILLSISISSVYFNGRVDMYSCLLGNSLILYYFYGIIGSIMFFVFCSLFLNKKSKIIEIISVGSILILAYHTVFISFVRFLAQKVSAIEINTFYSLILSAIIVFSFYKPIIIFRNKFPLFLGFR